MSQYEIWIGPKKRAWCMLGIAWDWRRKWRLSWHRNPGATMLFGSCGVGPVWLYYGWRE